MAENLPNTDLATILKVQLCINLNQPKEVDMRVLNQTEVSLVSGGSAFASSAVDGALGIGAFGGTSFGTMGWISGGAGATGRAALHGAIRGAMIGGFAGFFAGAAIGASVAMVVYVAASRIERRKG